MTVHLVSVRSRQGERYIDSIWINGDNAAQRVNDLKMELKRCGYTISIENNYWWVWSSETTMPDGRLAEGSDKEPET